ncbi:integrase/recombinase XerC [Streptosporangium becharense]|uniref:Integrase/recombinase XerC n=1 Tax=Streptosporangium becharense TaxID=1816182 RepID=A0A7W9ME88_9ACTN|nr:tyrosine-type recombinase/integrase [Streptosporangium becharense]MBB2914037.1 integrase/recombinase XerC [Streptosporangium becharense]MBB5817064.1 integrase/recombinase XerC [Streptosporangium becharense]
MWGGQYQAVPQTYATVHAAYAAALERAPLDSDTRRAYDSRVRTFLAWLDGSSLDGDPLTDAHDRDFAVRDYKTHMKTVLHWASNTVNAHLTALDHFFAQLGLGPAIVRRDDAPKLAPRALGARQQKRYLRAVERRPLARDRAIGRLLFYSDVRIAELVALDDDDVPLSARKGKVIVRSGKGETSREIPLLDGTARASVAEWRTERASWPGAADNPALLLNRRGGRLTTRAVDQLIDELATDADILDEAGAVALFAYILRHTLATNLLRAGVDIVVVAELLGHARLDTTRRCTLPAHADLEDAVGRLPTDQ